MIDVVDSYILMWGLSYPACAVLKPDLIKSLPFKGEMSKTESVVALLSVGGIILTGLALRSHPIGRAIFTVMGVAETFGGWASWIGSTQWNVPFEDKAPFQISMGVLDLISAVVLLLKGLGGV